ncbi:AraC family transcriptional regulator [Rhizobium leguminosarum]|nr:AraC family transcriptional regulator [Rhizobium leguminosarum]
MPSGLSERAKFSQWQDIHNAQIWSVDYTEGSLPFSATIEATAVGPLTVGQMSGTIRKASRQARHIASDGNDAYLLLINRTETPLVGFQTGRQYSVGHGDAAFVSAAEALEMTGGDENLWFNIVIPREVVTASFGHVDDLLAYRIDARNEALLLLGRYCRSLDSLFPLNSPAIVNHVSETILDLVGLASGARGERRELASQRGLREARFRAILEKIDGGFTSPAFSARSVGIELGLSERYIQDILERSGTSFTERVLELRLQRAMTMLEAAKFQGVRISDIALAAGFGDISYFNRCFRRRFGVPPTAVG